MDRSLTLEAGDVRLRPLRREDAESLYSAAGPREVWELLTQPVGRSLEDAIAFVEDALARPDTVPFAIEQGGKVVGTTRYYKVDEPNRTAAIGFTLHHPSVWRTHVNSTCKRLLLDHAFRAWELHRVFFEVDSRNARSQAAVLRLGAIKEGVLRDDRVSTPATSDPRWSSPS